MQCKRKFLSHSYRTPFIFTLYCQVSGIIDRTIWPITRHLIISYLMKEALIVIILLFSIFTLQARHAHACMHTHQRIGMQYLYCMNCYVTLESPTNILYVSLSSFPTYFKHFLSQLVMLLYVGLIQMWLNYWPSCF